MFKNLKVLPLVKYGLLAAVLFSIPMIFFIRESTFSQSWLLYLGNFLFMLSVAGYMIYFSERKNENASTTSHLITGHVVTVIGVIVALIVSLIAIFLFVPGIFQSGQADQVLERAPAQEQGRKTDGLIFMVLMNAVVGNVSTGSFVSIILSYYQKRDQTKEGIPLDEGRRA
jgi:heme/copper-type cytochrome/quinol oxidase subunit 2